MAIDRSGQLPGRPTNPDSSDLVVPIQAILRGIDSLTDVNDDGTLKSTGGLLRDPDSSAALIESTATSISKVGATVVVALGGISTIGTWIAVQWAAANTPLRVTAVGGVCFCIAALAIAFAIIISTDVRARGRVAESLYETRQAVATAALQCAMASAMARSSSESPHGGPGRDPATEAAQALIALAASGAPVAISDETTGATGLLSGLRYHNGLLQIGLRTSMTEEDYVTLSEISSFHTT